MTAKSRRLGGLSALEPGLPDQLKLVPIGDPCNACATERKLVAVNSVGFDVLTKERFSERIERFVRCGRSHAVHFLSAHPTVVARQVPRYGRLFEAADLVVSDGAPIVLTMRAKGRGARRVTSTDGFGRICDGGQSRQLRHFLVGGASDAVVDALSRNLLDAYPKILIVGTEVPPFRPYEDEELAELAAVIRSRRAQVVWVGLGAPKQEILVHRLRALDVAPVVVSIGATFDFVAATKGRAPSWMRRFGLEWVYRLGQEPGRLWRRYLVGNFLFIGGVLEEGVRNAWPGTRYRRSP